MILKKTYQVALEKDIAMTVDPNSIDLAQLMTEHLERAEPDLLRELLRVFVQALMSADADAACGAEYGTRTPDRVNSRNGYRPREFDTRVGTIELALPKLRAGYVRLAAESHRLRAQVLHRSPAVHGDPGEVITDRTPAVGERDRGAGSCGVAQHRPVLERPRRM